MRLFLSSITALCLGFCGAAMAQAAVDPGSLDLNKLVHPALYFGLSSLLGMIGHAVKKWVRGETPSNPLQYFTTDNGKASVAALTAVGSAVATAALTHQLDGMTAAQLVVAGFTTGSTLDSYVNKATPNP